MRIPILFVGLTFAFWIFSAVSTAQSLIIDDVNIYDVTTGEIGSPKTVVVLDGLISRIGSPQAEDWPKALTRVSGAGLTMLPGMTDAHVHMTEIDAGTFLANGVTSIRELNGSHENLRLRDEIEHGNILGPRMLVSSPLLSGRIIDFRHQLIETPDDAERFVKEFHQDGYDYLKIYDDLSESTYHQLVETARSLNVELVGHIPDAVGLDGVLAANQAIEHNEKIVVDVLGHDMIDVEPLRQSALAIAKSGIVVTPTLAVHEFLDDRQGADVQRRLVATEINYVDRGILAWWKSTFARSEGDNAASRNSGASDFLEAQRFLLKEMDRLGVPILAGTDTPNPLMVPGFGLHDELDALTRAGLSNAAAIRAATLTAGRELAWSASIGEVKVGYAADLILVRGNPAHDLSVLRRPVGVIASGVWLNKKRLNDLLLSSQRD